MGRKWSGGTGGGIPTPVAHLASPPPATAEAEAEEGWTAIYDASLTACMHGPGCKDGGACSAGRRLTGVTILSGSVVRLWDCLERVLGRHELELNKADRGLRIVRVEWGDGALPLIGVCAALK